MLTNPFTGKELFIFYETTMGRLLCIEPDDAWDAIGKTKKQTWNNMAKMINERMRSEPLYIKGAQS